MSKTQIEDDDMIMQEGESALSNSSNQTANERSAHLPILLLTEMISSHVRCITFHFQPSTLITNLFETFQFFQMLDRLFQPLDMIILFPYSSITVTMTTIRIRCLLDFHGMSPSPLDRVDGDQNKVFMLIRFF